MATLSTQVINRTGVAPTFASAAGGGDRFTPGQYTFLRVKNGGGSPITVTVAATGKVDGDISLTNPSFSVAAGADGSIGPFPGDQFLAVDGSGLADITYSGVTSVTVAVLQLKIP